MVADTEMEVPSADVDREVAVEHRDGRLGGEADLVCGALDHRTGIDLGPVLGEDLRQQALDDVAPNRDLVVFGDTVAGPVLHRARRHRAHGSAV